MCIQLKWCSHSCFKYRVDHDGKNVRCSLLYYNNIVIIIIIIGHAILINNIVEFYHFIKNTDIRIQ